MGLKIKLQMKFLIKKKQKQRMSCCFDLKAKMNFIEKTATKAQLMEAFQESLQLSEVPFETFDMIYGSVNDSKWDEYFYELNQKSPQKYLALFDAINLLTLLTRIFKTPPFEE